MGAEHPPVYVLNGDDEYAISQFIAQLSKELGDPSMADLNTTRLDGRSVTPEQLESAILAMPFLAPQRLVVLTRPLERLKSPAQRENFIKLLEKTPASTRLVLVHSAYLTDARDRGKKVHWLAQWASEKHALHTFAVPHGEAMLAWILSRAKALGGQFTRPAAARLAELCADEPRLADLEVRKLLTYVNFARPVEADDVDHLTPDARQGDIFALVDALGGRNARRAQELLHQLLREQEPLYIFSMIIRQFRLLLQIRESLDQGASPEDMVRDMHQSPFVVKRLIPQARHFALPALEEIYHRLLNLDEAIKTGQVEQATALDLLIASFN
jgi:DNA polymerase-3 subunit delta